MEHDREIVQDPPQLSALEQDEENDSPSSEVSRQGEGERAQASKATQILEACNGNDLPMLIAHATSPQGLMEDGIRRLTCTS